MRSSRTRNGFGVACLAAATLVLCSGGPRALAAPDEFRAIACSRFEWPKRDLAACQAYIDTLMQRLHDAHFNAVIFQVRGQADTLYPSPYEPWSDILSDDGNAPVGWGDFDPVAYAINKAHENGLEFHAYINAHVCWNKATDPPAPNHLFYQHCRVTDPAHRDWLCCDSSGTPIGYSSGNEYTWIAPGIPDFQAYWRKQVMYVVEHYDGSDPVTRPRVDGVHFDRIRTNSTDWSHDPISEARRLGEANPASLSFADWTRDQITRTLCDLYAQVNENHPDVMVSSAPLGMHSGSRYIEYGYPLGDCSYGGYGYSCKYQDPQGWLAAGAQDFICPQIYWADEPWRTIDPHFSEILPDWLTHNSGRHVYAFGNVSATGAGLLSEVSVVRTMSAAVGQGNARGNVFWYYGGFFGLVPPTYTVDLTPLFTGPGGPYEEPANVPAMPWKDTPTDAIILGTVSSDGTNPITDVQITRTGSTYTALSSADGIYSFLKVPPGTYSLTFVKSGFAPRTINNVSVVAGQVLRVPDVALSGTVPPVITNVQATGVTNNAATITWTTDSASTSQVNYGLTASYGSSSPLDSTQVMSHSVTISGLTPSTVYHYQVTSTNDYGPSTSSDYTFTTDGPPSISNVQATGITGTGATITWSTAGSPSNSQVRYGLTSSYGSQTTLDPAYVTSHSVTLSGLMPNTLYHYQAVSTNAYGPAQSADRTFTTTVDVADIVIDNTDPGWADTSTTGSWNIGSSSVVPKIGTNYLYASATGSALESSATTKCTWTPNITVAGLYDVYAYCQMGTNRNASAPFRVVYDGGQVDSTLNQYSSIANQGNWFLIGADVPFAAGTAGYAQCANNSADSGLISADAAKFVYKGAASAPTITTQPLPQILCPGGIATFSVAATGVGTLSFQWQKGGSDLSDDGHYSGVATGTLTVSSVNAGDDADYRCVVRNLGGSANSNPAALTVKAATTITQQPQAATVDTGATATFTVAATGDGTLGYRWQKDGTDLSDGGHYAGTGTATLSVTTADSGDAGSYACVVTGGCGAVTSGAATLTVTPPPSYVPADFDHDNDVDLDDFTFFRMCFQGPNRTPLPECGPADFDGDQDVDLEDFVVFRNCFNGPNRLPVCP